MTRPIWLILGVALVMAARAAAAQDLPPRNPIFVSITGTNAEPVIFRDVSLSTYDLLTGSLAFDKTDTSARATFAPFKLKEQYTPVLSEIALNFSQAKGVTTFGVGAAYNSRSGFSPASIQSLNNYLTQIPTFRSQQPGEDTAAYKKARAAYYRDLWPKIFDRFYSDLARNAFIVSVAANLQTFGTLGGDHVDLDEDGKIDNFYNRKGYDLSATLTYSASQAAGLTASAHYGKHRISAVEGQDLASYPGLSVSVARRVKTLNADYRTTDDYFKSLFIPGVVVGAALEWQHCNGTATSCDDGLQSRTAVTPFLEIKVTPTAQFRIGVPIQRSVNFGKKTQIALGSAVQYAIQLTGAK